MNRPAATKDTQEIRALQRHLEAIRQELQEKTFSAKSYTRGYLDAINYTLDAIEEGLT